MIGHFRTMALAGLAALILGLGLSSAALADGHQIKFRKAIMGSIGGTMGGLVGVLKKQAPAAYAAPLAANMNNLAQIADGIFPEGSDFGETRALPAIWEKPADFKKAVAAFQMAAANLSTAAASGDMAAFGAAFEPLGKACKGCHDNFREEKK
mgnify:CR=1 FL=1